MTLLGRLALVVWVGVALGGPRSASARGHEKLCVYSPELAEALRHAYPDSDIDDDGVLSREEACGYQAALRKRFSRTETQLEAELTAKRWVYATYFNRLKRQVAMSWDPQSVWRRSDPTGARHGFRTRVTEVRVSLSPKGDLAKIVVISPSGITELDDEAVRAFRAAAPFPNPPDGLIKDNLITFEFSFHFEIGAPRTSWRVIRP